MVHLVMNDMFYVFLLYYYCYYNFQFIINLAVCIFNKNCFLLSNSQNLKLLIVTRKILNNYAYILM